MKEILVAEDDDFVRILEKEALEGAGYRVFESKCRQSTLQSLEDHNVSLILLDIILSKDNGIELITDIKQYTKAPIIMVSGKSGLADKVMSLEMGADDYMSKPVEMKELLARIRANIRRYEGEDSAIYGKGRSKLAFDNWVMDSDSFSVRDCIHGRDAALTKDEFDLLLTLARSPNVVFSREKLFEILKADNYEVFDRSIDIQIARIRKKLGDDAKLPRIIKTVRKVGYQFIANASHCS